MTTTSTDPRDIEADLDRERAALAQTLDTLSDRVSVDNLTKEALGMLKGSAGSVTSTIDHTVRANPLAVALIGAGIAWMFLGNKVTGSGKGAQASGSTGTFNSGSAGWSGTDGGTSGYGQGFAQENRNSAYYAGSSTSSSYDSSSAYDASDDHSWSREASGLRARAMSALHRIEQEAKSYYDSLRNALPGSGSSSQGTSRDFEAERQSVISTFTSDLRSRLSSGLDSLPEGSREQIVAARERAYSAMLQAERAGRDAIRDPGRAMEEHPFAAGAVAFALGAAVAAMLPQTEAENRAFGQERDRLLDEAARLLKEERGRAMQIAGSLGDEVKAAAQETVEAVTDTVTNKAKEAASRVGDRASEEIRTMQQPQGGSGSSGLAGPGDPVVG